MCDEARCCVDTGYEAWSYIPYTIYTHPGLQLHPPTHLHFSCHPLNHPPAPLMSPTCSSHVTHLPLSCHTLAHPPTPTALHFSCHPPIAPLHLYPCPPPSPPPASTIVPTQQQATLIVVCPVLHPVSGGKGRRGGHALLSLCLSLHFPSLYTFTFTSLYPFT
ncbi:hypothetical protein Pmani_010785 [Petrolisthes manimaculis]|uniref:Uncharacterized protein n=1 Tax=Petrolisthes manimaculis TaxID=1843537 RepID=A0AAE1Q2F6_9EUCA|nr:hypothetical protein Pmani_010785 [Petrolisthes manimaculis]